MNAIFFNGTWQSKFDARNTKEANFAVTPVIFRKCR